MVREGIILRHKISTKEIVVNQAKIEATEKLPPPASVKGIRSFLGHADFYRRFIKDFSNIAKSLSNLLMQGVPFFFDEDCNLAFLTLKEKLISTPIVITPDWEHPFKLMPNVSDYVVVVVLRQKSDRVFHAIYYVIRTLNEAYLNYTTNEKELLANFFFFLHSTNSCHI